MNASRESRTLTIEGDLVRLQTTTVDREVRTADFLREIARLHPLDTDILPRNCAWYARRENPEHRLVGVYAIERPAGPQAVRFNDYKGGSVPVESKTLTLSWPNTVWFVRCVGPAIQDVYPACTAAPLAVSGAETRLFQILMPNIYDGGNGPVCMGDLTVHDGKPLCSRINDLMAAILDSHWNSDLMPRFGETGVEGLDDWAEKSARDPEFHGKIRFPDHPRGTAGGMMDALLSDLKG